jgi:RNA polymerase sigma factor (sigma-70 family)
MHKDSEAWEQFVRKYSKLIWSCIHKTFRSSSFRYTAEDVEDVYSTIFLSLLENNCKKLQQFQSRNACALSTWLAVVAIRQAIDYLRRQRCRPAESAAEHGELFDLAMDKTPSIDTVLMKKQQNQVIEAELAALSSQDRAMFDLLSGQNLKPEAAAQKLGISMAAFYTRKHRLIEKFKKI